MRTVEEIIEQARCLSAKDRRMLLEELEESLEEEEPATEKASAKGLYARSLALAGTMHSDYTDVSTDKYKHLGEAYADQRDEE
jgi:hypothetical protein